MFAASAGDATDVPWTPLRVDCPRPTNTALTNKSGITVMQSIIVIRTCSCVVVKHYLSIYCKSENATHGSVRSQMQHITSWASGGGGGGGTQEAPSVGSGAERREANTENR